MTLSVILSVFLVTGLVQAASTISTNIATDGNLSVVGIESSGMASTTVLSVNNTAFFGGSATTTIGPAGLITAQNITTLGTSASGRASTTVFSVNNTAFFGGTATTTIGPTGSITQGTTNAATTSIAVGCIQTVATSTVTPIRIVFSAGEWATSSTRVGQVNSGQGLVLWQYGSCP